MDILEYMARNGAIVSLTQLYAAGFSPGEVSRAARCGQLKRVVRGWVAIEGASPVTRRAIEAGGRVSCLDVLRGHRVWSVNDRRLHVRIARGSGHSPTIAEGRRLKTPIVVHRALPGQPLGVFAVDPLPVALAHAVLCQPWMDAVASLDSAMNRGYLSFVQVAELLEPLPAKYARYLDLVDPKAESGLEMKARLSLRAANIRFRTQVVIPSAGRVDILIGDRLVLEVDGWKWHSEKDDASFDVIRAKIARGEHLWSARQRRAGFGG